MHLWGEGGGTGWRRLCQHSGPHSAGKPSPGVKAAPGHSSQAEHSSDLPSASGALLRGRTGLGHPGTGSAPEKPPGPGIAGCLPPEPSPTSHCQPLPPALSLTWWRLGRSGSPSWGWEWAFASCFSGIFTVLCWTPATGTQGRCCLLMEPLSWEWGTLGLWPHKSPLGLPCGPLSQWPLGTPLPPVTKAWPSPWRRGSCLCAASPLGTLSPRPTAGHLWCPLVQPPPLPPPWPSLDRGPPLQALLLPAHHHIHPVPVSPPDYSPLFI